MDDISKKNEGFLNDELRILRNIEELDLCRKNIFSLVEQHLSGVTTNMPAINSKLEEASYYKTVIDDTSSSINMYAASIVYTAKDVQKYVHATKKNAHINTITIPHTIPLKEFVDDFTIDITNLGYDGVADTDLLLVSMYSIDTLVHTETVLPVGKIIKNIGDRGTITIHGLPCPNSHNQYSMDFLLVTDEDIEYSSVTIQGINVADQGNKGGSASDI